MKTGFWKLVGGVVLGLAGLGSANAGLVVGEWDPAFGTAFNSPSFGLGWKATATFNVPGLCLASNGVHLNDGSDLCTGGANNIGFAGSILVSFYNNPNPLSVFETHLFTISNANLVSVNILGGQVIGLVTNPGTSSFAAGTTSAYGVDLYNFQIGFNGSTAKLNALALNGLNNPQNCSGDLGCVSGAALGTFTNVPEPGSLALVLGALAGLAVYQRKRQTV